MTAVVTYVEVQPAFTGQAVTLFSKYRRAASAEKGSIDIGVLQETHRPNRFAILETWSEESDFQVHEGSAHTTEFRSAIRSIHGSPYDQRVHHAFAPDVRTRLADPTGLFVLTHVDVPPPRREEAEVLLQKAAVEGTADSGNRSYAVFQQNAPRTNHFTILSVWESREAFASHGSGPHTLKFREALGPLLGALYDERLYGALPLA